MKVKGFQGTSLLDFPGKIASLVFFGGCNLTCPFCHNPSLVLDPEQYPDYPLAALLDELRERRSFIDGVVVTGGEPTVDRDLLPFLREVKGLGLLVKLDTNGLAPQVMRQALGEGLLDQVALDMKTAPHRYGELHTAPVEVGALSETIEVLREAEVPCEFRTTCVPGFVEKDDIAQIGEAIAGARRWVLQQFVPDYALNSDVQNLEPHPPEHVRELAALAQPYAEEVLVRGL